jgi:hypothetical protein
MAEKVITLTHPVLGDQDFPEAQAKAIMSREKNGGWEFKKPLTPKQQKASLSNEENSHAINAGANSTGDKGVE